MLEKVSGHPFYCFLDGYSGYFQIEIIVEDQEKTTFTCPLRTYAYRIMFFDDTFLIGVLTDSHPLNGHQQQCHLIRVQLVFLDCGPQTGVINKIYNLLHHVLG